ncbi:hypothetical protein CPB83DRAFT_942090 [Crepidotus variabilis]|uniref:SnoaL-like domain-containing protein n=1 Tax=Crepidotus variabilis TaxID=179855 RepID=A0A9P6JLS6_9AGAR|nr:hypothetical protein CPB83DRAFT_942090 [Crepidotus variabilis]
MRASSFALSLILATSGILPTLAAVCSTTTPATEQQQSVAFKAFADIFLVQKNIQKAFDDYIPDTYINHNPTAQSGRANAINALKPFWSGISITPAAVFSGGGFGLLHYRVKMSGTDMAVMDRYRLNGTCIVEHWDVNQSITGREANPIAFF